MDEEEESVADVDPGEVLPKDKRRWVRTATSELRTALRVGLRVGLRWGRRWGWPAVKWLAAFSLPFFVLVRGSMYAYQSMGWGTWSSIGLGVFGTVVVFSAYATWL
jgi:hypothetical protein